MSFYAPLSFSLRDETIGIIIPNKGSDDADEIEGFDHDI